MQLGGSHQTLGYFEDCTKTMDIYYLTFPFTVHFDEIRQYAWVSEAGAKGGLPIVFQSPNGSLELANARADDRVWGMSLSI